jgi:hypothetical protein
LSPEKIAADAKMMGDCMESYFEEYIKPASLERERVKKERDIAYKKSEKADQDLKILAVKLKARGIKAGASEEEIEEAVQNIISDEFDNASSVIKNEARKNALNIVEGRWSDLQQQLGDLALEDSPRQTQQYNFPNKSSSSSSSLMHAAQTATSQMKPVVSATDEKERRRQLIARAAEKRQLTAMAAANRVH